MVYLVTFVPLLSPLSIEPVLDLSLVSPAIEHDGLLGKEARVHGCGKELLCRSLALALGVPDVSGDPGLSQEQSNPYVPDARIHNLEMAMLSL